MPLPALAGLGKILALMRAAALFADQCGSRDALGDETHAAQVVEIEPFGIESGAGCRKLGAFRGEAGDVLERACEARTGAQRADVLVHHLLKVRDFCSRIDS